jgi:hypothetical protein
MMTLVRWQLLMGLDLRLGQLPEVETSGEGYIRPRFSFSTFYPSHNKQNFLA